MDAIAACQDFIDQHNPQQIALQLRIDSAFCKAGKRPSLLAILLPSQSAELADQISKHLYPVGDDKFHELPRSVRELWYTGLVDGVKTYLSQLSVIEYASLSTEKSCDLGSPEDSIRPPKNRVDSRKQRRNVLCYICRFVNDKPHNLTPSLCEACGSFNLANSLISLPGSLDLRRKIALVTGGRVNLGFSTALRLLRCGARVIVSSRYPEDAETRFLAEVDSQSWFSRLKIVGADFRTAQDAFNLVEIVKRQLASWSEIGRLDILINNAAQTLTDSIRQETRAVERERLLKTANTKSGCVLGDKYAPRVRGGNGLAWESSLLWHGNLDVHRLTGSQADHSKQTSHDSASAISNQVQDAVEPASKSSWAQSLREIPYEDLVTAHSVNFFVPLILCRELLPLMSKQRWNVESHDAGNELPKIRGDESNQLEEDIPSTNTSAELGKALGYIINVSSREGIFENKIGAEAKNGKHVHTNTSKAALNMITETEADNCWRSHKVAMNTVDPGYMSAAPEIQDRGDCPITFEDGAARVLWPIAVAEREGRLLYGRFFKHFGAVKVDVGAGR